MNRPIGVFDSGVGGISILKELVKLMPNENYIYMGDSANAPYGSKAAEEVQKLATENVEKLISMDAKAVVIACNTATSVAAESLRKKHPEIPIIGVEPALKPAVLHKENSVIVVMGTPITLHEHKFHDLMSHYSDRAEIISLPCHNLAAMIEKGILEGNEMEAYLKELFKPLKNKKIDSVVLGCTHYPFIKKSILKVFGNVAIFDGGEGTARETKRRLEEDGTLSHSNKKGKITILNSLNSNEQIKFSQKLLYL
ncbi:MAG: glutamate racemase [Bacillota bacterium]|nr:glutamate racemase [Bacillota bacterium]